MERISIKPEREYMRQILVRLDEGKYGIPAFQRDFVWKPGQVIDLFDSILKGYPIGSIILWSPKGENIPAVKSIKADIIDETCKPVFYILDGRQRVTAFYGCVMSWDGKPEIFKLYYDLAADTLTYKPKGKKMYAYLLSDIYDTIKTLGIMQEIMQSSISPSDKERYIYRLKEVNTILQSYEIGEMILENCTLEESSTAFSRINSKGTDISKVAMLQALTYKNKNSVLLADEINELINSLSVYGFELMKPDDVLSCCYRYVGKKFYDSGILDSIVKCENLRDVLRAVKNDVTKAVTFLYNDCGVISYKLLPYTKQLFAIAAFFKEKPEPTAEQKNELKRWFFYTTYKQTFMNSSLTNVRNVFNRFESFINEEKETAIEYDPIVIDYRLDFIFKPASALSDFIILNQINKRRQSTPIEALSYSGEFSQFGKKPASAIALLSSSDKSEIMKMIKHEDYSLSPDLSFLSDEIIESMRSKKVETLIRLRKNLLVTETKDFLRSLEIQLKEDLEVEETAEESTPIYETDINNLIGEFDDLNNEERRELCEILSNGLQAQSVIYNVSIQDDHMLISYASFYKPYYLTPEEARKCLRLIEQNFCNGEDAESYFSWLIATEQD